MLATGKAGSMSPYATLSIATPIATTVLGIAMSFGGPGMAGNPWALGVFIALGLALSVGFAVASYWRHERLRALSLAEVTLAASAAMLVGYALLNFKLPI